MSTYAIPAVSISHEGANRLIAATLSAARDMRIDVAVAVTDAAGHLRAFERTDGALFLTAEVAVDKAWSAASFGLPTHVWNDYVSNDSKVTPLAYRPRLVAVGGGYPIIDAGTLIGGLGISGGNYRQDQDIASAALGQLNFDVPN